VAGGGMGMTKRQNQKVRATESNQNTKQDLQQSEVNPVAVLLEWSDRKGMYALSVILAIIGVLGGMVPYVAAGNMVVGIFNGIKEWPFYLHWGLIAGFSYLVKIIFHHLSILFLPQIKNHCIGNHTYAPP